MKGIVATLFLLSSSMPLTLRQSAEVKRVEESLLAPCCYSQSVAQHMSAEAEQMRHEVTEMVASGRSETEIIDHYKALYGERILIVPDGRTGKILFALPVLISIASSGVLLLFLRKMLRARRNADVRTTPEERERVAEAFREEIERETGEAS
jgi:cytochrome c-type biogenesis protein CcmH/NrfF